MPHVSPQAKHHYHIMYMLLIEYIPNSTIIKILCIHGKQLTITKPDLTLKPLSLHPCLVGSSKCIQLGLSIANRYIPYNWATIKISWWATLGNPKEHARNITFQVRFRRPVQVNTSFHYNQRHKISTCTYGIQSLAQNE